MHLSSLLQTRIDITRSAAFRGIAGNIFKFALLLASGTGIGRRGCTEQKAAAPAFPVGETAARAEGSGG